MARVDKMVEQRQTELEREATAFSFYHQRSKGATIVL